MSNIFPMSFNLSIPATALQGPGSGTYLVFTLRFPIQNLTAGLSGLINLVFTIQDYTVSPVILPKASIYSGAVTPDDFNLTYSASLSGLDILVECSNPDWSAIEYPSVYSAFAYCNITFDGLYDVSFRSYLNDPSRGIVNYLLLPTVDGGSYFSPIFPDIFTGVFNPSFILTVPLVPPVPTVYPNVYRFRIPLECGEYCVKLFNQPKRETF